MCEFESRSTSIAVFPNQTLRNQFAVCSIRRETPAIYQHVAEKFLDQE